MSSSPVPAARAAPAGVPVRSPRLAPLACRLCGTPHPPAPLATCPECLGPLEPVYDPARPLPTRAEIEARPRSIWRYREWLPVLDAPVVSTDTGFTPLLDAPALARALGVRRALVKNDAVSHPTLSFKDRVVAVALNAARGLGLTTVGCASTGNLANAVAAQAARAGLDAWIFVPEDLEVAKIVGTAVYGPRLVRVRGTYDDVNRLCLQVADRFGWGLVNVNLRPYYGEGSKTVAFEISEQLGWRLPQAVIAPMAGGSLLTKIDKGFAELAKAGLAGGARPRMFGAQAAGCAPIVNLVASGGDRLEPVIPRTIARSIAIGNPADGRFAAAAIRASGGAAAAVTDAELVDGITLLARTTGIFTETAGGVTVAAARRLVAEGKLGRDDELVLCITGNGLKTTEAVQPALVPAPVIDPRLREVAALVPPAR
jgi:threonine synthase